MPPGLYFHFGLDNCLVNALDGVNFITLGLDHVEFLVGIDGVPVAKSIPEEFWPIMGQVKKIGCKKAFMIGLYNGPSKPDNVNDFLHTFVLEVIELTNNGLSYKGLNIKVTLMGFVCDAPARGFCLCVKSHTGFAVVVDVPLEVNGKMAV